MIIEQLRLLLRKKHGRQYSPQLMILAYMLMASSTSAYNVLLQEIILSFPSVATLKTLTRNIEAATNTESETYLQLRVSKLGEHERTVFLITDEIYVSKHIEYANGDIIGLTNEGKAASTLLWFMIKSIGSALQGYCGHLSSRQTDCIKDA